MDLGIITVFGVMSVVFAIEVIVWANSNKGAKPQKEEKVEQKNKKVEKPVKPVANAKKESVGDILGDREIQKLIKLEVAEETKPVKKTFPIKKTAAPVKAEPVKKPVPVKKVEPVKEITPLTLEIPEDEENGNGTDFNALQINRVPFAKKLLGLGKEVCSYYNLIYNFFSSYRKINPRVSNSCVSFRFGRDLVAKLTIRGKTMKLHLALKTKDYDEKLYFQKDLSGVKAYRETPFTVKVKSERSTRRALELIAALAVEKGIEKKARFNEIDALEEIKAKA